jgi:alkanesulfonate monooxygenase SsuD/methylene tetrahydromethanopterin reductase-like flavin-dependent oxidoreductase (luciferase family)
MRYGLSFLPDATPSMKSAADYYQDTLALSERADQAGLHFIKMTEHYLHPYGGYCPNPITFLAAVASRTQHIRLMTGGVLPVFHHPLQLAAQASMLDAISGGRAEIGFARAYLPYEFDAFGIDLDGSRERFTETVRAVLALWQEQSVTIKTKFFSFANATMLPPCTQTPHPPVWVTAVISKESFAWIGREGFKQLVTPGLGGIDTLQEYISIYRECFAENHPDQTSEVAISLPIYIHKTDREAIQRGDFYLQRYLDVWADAAQVWNTASSSDYAKYTGFGHALKADTPEAMRRRGSAIIGCPQRVVEQTLKLKEMLGVDTILWQIDFGAMPGEDARRSLDLFIDEVWPSCL